MKNTIYVNHDKLQRAEDIYLLLTGKRPKDTTMSAGHKEYLLSRFTDILAEEKISLAKTDPKEVIDFIYKKLAGAVRTVEQEEKIKESAKRNKIGSSRAKEAIDTSDDADDDDDDDDDK